jgi:hypothetical protein
MEVGMNIPNGSISWSKIIALALAGAIVITTVVVTGSSEAVGPVVGSLVVLLAALGEDRDDGGTLSSRRNAPESTAGRKLRSIDSDTNVSTDVEPR